MRRLLICAPLAAFALACGGGSTGPKGPTASSIIVAPDSLNLNLDESRLLSAVVLDGEGAQLTGTSVTFSSADSTIARVTAGGAVTARGAGTTIVSAAVGSVRRGVPVVVRHDPASRVAATVPVSGCPYGIATTSDGKVLVSQICGGSVTALSLPALGSVGTVQTLSEPAHVAVNPAGTVAYTANQGGQGVSVVDIGNRALVATIALHHDGFNLLVSADGTKLYVTTADAYMFVISTATRTIIDSVRVGAQANGLALDPTKPILYVSSIAAGTITAIDTRTNAITRTYALGSQPQRIAVSPDGTELFAADNSVGLVVLNLANGSFQRPNVGGSGLGLAMDRQGDYVYVSVLYSGSVVVVSRKTHAVLGTIFVDGDPRNIAIAPDGGVLVANQSGWVSLLR